MAGNEGGLSSNALGRIYELSESADETTLDVDRRGNGGVTGAENDPSREGNGGGGGRFVFASAYTFADGVFGGGGISCCASLRGGGTKSRFTGAAEEVLLVVEVEVRRGGDGSSSLGFLPRAALQAAEPVLSTRSLKFLRASSSPQRLRGMVGVSGQNTQ